MSTTVAFDGFFGGRASTLTSETTTEATLPPTSDSSQERSSRSVDSDPEKITFGGKGRGPGKFEQARGVAVSRDNEIFVADEGNKRVQVFSMNGAFLRLFPAVVPGVNGQTMHPNDVAIDGEEYVWVAGSNDSNRDHGYVVKYSREGQPELNHTYMLRNMEGNPPSIAFDAVNNKVIAGANSAINIFSPDVSSAVGVKVFNKRKRIVMFITSDNEGNRFVTEARFGKVHVFNQDGHRLFRFWHFGKLEGKGIIADNSGHLIIANVLNNRVDMFTNRGEFVRTVVEVESPWGIALGPGGQLVVTNLKDHIVTIFPHHMVFPYLYNGSV
ncbi:tripartite motif-containing protein 2-like [Branchiostoma lanceolatum]|uniref:tripartite motif-containing protein 2-like n=1 Tax=Branchiostoma lanceolatum TaxID=7740 RepID=UPI003451E3DF